MQAKVFEITGKVKKWDLDLARATDFTTSQPVAGDAGKIIAAPHISLYCLDDEVREAVFVEAPPDVDVSQQAFLFLAQYKNAQRLWKVSYETLHQLATGMEGCFTRLIPMYSMGRCGGTLVSRALNRLGCVLSLDEPDVYSHIVQMRPNGGSRDVELSKLIFSSTRLLFKPFKPSADTLFLKFRPWCTVLGDLFYKAFPSGKAMFLYRNAETWARSATKSIESVAESSSAEDAADPFLNVVRRLDVSNQGGEKLASPGRAGPLQSVPNPLPLLRDYVRREVAHQLSGAEKLHILGLALAQRVPGLRSRCQSPIDYVRPYISAIPSMKLMAAIWLSMLDQYLKLRAQGIPLLGVRYETLVADPERALAAIFQYCGLPTGQVVVAEGAFAEDSQKGTPLSREKVGRAPLAPELVAQLREVLSQYPFAPHPDFVAPGTLELAAPAPAR
jgi:hypothetical protein